MKHSCYDSKGFWKYFWFFIEMSYGPRKMSRNRHLICWGGAFPPPKNFGVRDIFRLFWSIGSIQNMLISHENFHRYVHSTKTDIFKNSWKKSHIDEFWTLKENSVKIEISKNALFWSKIFQKSDMCLKSCQRQGLSIPNNWFVIGDL